MASDSIHTYYIPVRWSDFDRYGHIMNANYVEIAQEARLAFAEDNFYSQDIDFAAFVRHLDVDFRKPIEPEGNAQLLVESQVVEVGNTSFVTRQEIKDKHGRTACVVECVQVAIDLETQIPRSLTEQERDILLNIGRTHDDEAEHAAAGSDVGLGEIGYDD
ncbi:acyl-CoA thioesterase [Corynebacterium ammoniagenes]|uniref:Thioesterase n=2 Tax=Corynebacterium ammoniagenes TaxID=1697 RepID=A0AAV5GA86_CORAM|nr:thioesterase family protein [Corynebacterium ammoniagenes]APT83283.1 thioesterase [Corynebacterium ammoniagenes DSM 20306]AQS74300.1 thioesterase [Corynebacterium ammoniagenes]EFG81473.1 acyl-CoA thioester hydrolase, YbgC/YbaW family [Corynebacterium ammoniagenes DSM 20306]GJN43583.1 thioesterase [Corynebacterium ammoniagenes]